MTSGPIRVGGRPSPLSVAQIEWVRGQLAARGVESEFVPITTQGDTDRRHLTQIGGTGVFAHAVRAELLAGRIDLAVHSAKDLPTAPVAGLVVAAHPVREVTADVLVGRRLEDLVAGVRIGTGSPRRAAQLRGWAAGQGIPIETVAIRGNVGTRLELVKSGEVDAVVLAAAGLTRLGLMSQNSFSIDGQSFSILDDSVMLPAPAQGALALEVAENSEIINQVTELDDPITSACVAAERALLARLEAGCLAPVGAIARPNLRCDSAADLTMSAVIGKTLGNQWNDELAPEAWQNSEHGSVELIRTQGTGQLGAAPELGHRLAGELLDRLTE